MPPSTPKILPLAQKGAGSAAYWRSQLEWSAEVRKELLPGWRTHTDAYRDRVKAITGEGHTSVSPVRVNIEFEKTEQKRWQLFFRQPKLRLRPLPRTVRDAQPDPLTGQPGRDLKRVVAVFTEVLSYLVGPKHANLKAVMDEIVFDVLCPSGIGFVKVGYERYTAGTVPIQIGMQPDPQFQPPPGVLIGPRALPPMVPIIGQAPNIISEKYYGSRISPAQALIPAEFRQSDYSGQADWLGHDFEITPAEATRRKWPIDTSRSGSATTADDNQDRIVELDRKGTSPSDKIKCRVVYYYPQRIDGSADHPDKIRMLVFAGDHDDPVVHQDYPDQRFDDRGRFIGGLRTLPIKVLTLRYVSDTAYPPSDCAISRRQADELSEYRTQMSTHRRRAVPLEWIDVNGIVDERIKDLVRKGEYYDIVPTDGPGDRFMGAIPRSAYPQDNYRANDYFMADVNRLWALGANQSGTTEKTGATATEIASIQQATANRLGGEREKVTVQFYCALVEAFGQLAQLYMDEPSYVEILGQDGAKVVEAVTKDTIRGEFLYDIVPNSAAPPDAAADRDLALNRYNLVANDPFINRERLLRDTLEAYDTDDIDPLIKQPPPPQPPPEKHAINLAINGKDLDPSAPQYTNIVEICKAAGIALPTPSVATPGLAVAPPQGPANVVDRERLRMAATDNADQRAGGLTGVGIGRKP
jgi:hypothetical protein